MTKCICGHSIKSHVPDFDNTRCCAVWQKIKEDQNALSYLRFCECMKYEPQGNEKASLQRLGSSNTITYNALKSTSNKRDGSFLEVKNG